MTEPETYKGYSAEGDFITSKTAENANNYLDLPTVKTAAENLKKVSKEEFDNIIKLLEAEGDLSKEAITVQKMNMRSVILDVVEQVKTYPTAIESYADETVSRATAEHERIQQDLNSQCFNDVSNTPGVDTVA